MNWSPAWAAIDPGGAGSPDGTPDQPQLAIGCSVPEHHLCKQIPGCNIGKDDIWRVPLSWPAYVAFKTIWSSQPITESPSLQKWGADAWERTKDAYRMRAALDATNPFTISALSSIESRAENIENGHRELLPFQRGGVDWLVTMQRTLLEDPQGNGKTPQAIRSLQVLAQGFQGLPALVVAPPATLLGWQKQLRLWAPELTSKIITGTALQRKKLFDTEPADVTLIGWPTVRYHTRLARYPGTTLKKCIEHGGLDDKVTVGRCEVHLKELNEIVYQTVIADEAHRMGDAKALQTRAVWWLMQRARYAWLMTGTPVSDTIESLWSLMHSVDPVGFPAKSRYLDLYAVKGLAFWGGAEILDIRPDTASAFHATVQPMMRRIPKEIGRAQLGEKYHGVLPPVFRYPEMHPSQRTAYNAIKKAALLELKGEMLVPANSAVKFGRLVQLASSMIELEDGEDPYGFTRQVVELASPSNKADDLLDFLGDEPGQLVVAANSPRLIALCQKKLDDHKITSTKLVGGQSAAERHGYIDAFANGKVRVMFLTAGVGGEGIDGLQVADTVFFLQPNPSLIQREQVIGRLDRIGQHSPVRVVHSLTPGTVEKGLYELGNQKEERAAAVTRDADLLRWILQFEGDDDLVGSLK